ncbi:MAG TPA: tRNA-dihydrouridine synthase [Candidatus Paceibacterota bacterium]|nr:tRNA-dihydrouridine synthase [Candidatus Paceibacterota bacterium]
MNQGFWKKISEKKPACRGEPFFIMAPMADVTDAAFRRIITKYGKPDVFFTEFVSADGLCSEGKEHLMIDLMYSEGERPIVAQFFTSNPEKMFEAAKLAASLGFDGIDINMGCPDKTIEKQGAGAALIKDSRRARDVIRAAKLGAPNLPVSVKTRIGWSKPEMETWIPEILTEGIAALTIHARTRKEMSFVPARWEFVKQAVEIRDRMKVSTLIIGNGDVLDITDGKKKAKETGADGVMIGRGIFGNPWLFSSKSGRTVLPEKLKVMVEHTKLFEKLLGKHKNFAIMKKHFKAYVAGFDGAKELRIELMNTKNAKEVEKIVKQYLKDGTVFPISKTP